MAPMVHVKLTPTALAPSRGLRPCSGYPYPSMSVLLVVELVVISILVILAAITAWRSWSRGGDLARAPKPDGEEPTVLSVDLSDRDP